MLFDIRLQITYEYEDPAVAARHILHLMPAGLDGEQRLIAGSIDIQPPPDEWISRTDFFGNQVAEIAYRSPHSEESFLVQGRVERFARGAELDITPPLAGLSREIAGVHSLGPDAPTHFLGASKRVPIDDDITAYAREQISDGMTVFDIVRTFGLALNRDIRFDPEATTVETPPREAFDNRHGVCQDFTHIMIAGLRGLGIPAGYVSGFLRTEPPPGQPRLEGADAMHAWVRAWCGIETGWIEYDPTNAMMVGQDHIVIARGRDYFDVAPVKGVSRSSGTQTTKQAVDVIPQG
ncbi:transglutaminase family protein [Rhodobium gokarnense]|uniref:Transglutaminase-like putative cysteine protease n=1 Tax=Rhodobium gokarnense TaxID=364296 RepID=A0ABT3H7L8_9HYPH|nr:transglutaminase family protein [Rhodobium gokarnense]MCW2306379.1 transglutaminase-like putative cysteine protease [Rhodobium gokarnense]